MILISNNKIDLIGRKFGRLTVINEVEQHGKTRRLECKCDCGNEGTIIVRYPNLRSSHTKSCGCIKRKTLINRNEKYNSYELINEEFYVCYTGNKREFYIDKSDYDKIKEYYWGVDTYGYSYAYINDKRVCLSRYLLDMPEYISYDMEVVDHSNGITTDNRRKNLRICTRSDNQKNHKLMSHNSSGETGVSWSKSANKWNSYIHVNNQRVNLGYYDNFDKAVEVRKKSEEKYFGEFSYDNSRLS